MVLKPVHGKDDFIKNLMAPDLIRPKVYLAVADSKEHYSVIVMQEKGIIGIRMVAVMPEPLEARAHASEATALKILDMLGLRQIDKGIVDPPYVMMRAKVVKDVVIEDVDLSELGYVDKK